MVINDISGVPVDFPNEPYSSQLFMMHRIINSLIKGQNCLLELPTGSGKTMGLLCSTLAWYTNGALAVDPDTGTEAGITTKIFYGTRTHKQIQQVVRELSKTAYCNVRMNILSGRNQSCLNEEVKRKPDINKSCRDICRAPEDSQCRYRKKKNIKANEKMALSPGTWDLTSIKDKLQRIDCCPYYQMKCWLPSADIVFCPYNYILNPFIRRVLKVDLKRAVVILDEAHNIEDICRESTSLAVSSTEIELCLIQLHLIVNHGAQNGFLKQLIKMLVAVQALIKSLSVKTFATGEEVLKKCWNPLRFIEILKEKELAMENIIEYQGCLEQLNNFLRTSHSQAELEDIEDCRMIPETDNEENEEEEDECDHQADRGDYNNCYHGDDMDVYMEAQSTADKKPKKTMESPKYFSMSAESLNLMETLLMICRLIQDEKRNCSDDFSVVVTECWHKASMDTESKLELVLNLWCMNPGIAFKDIADNCHSIILTSGTLNPTASFQKELQCCFQSVFEAPHVVSADRTFIGSLSRGPTNKEIQAVFSNIETFEFKDELGRLILECSKVVPNGVLCFLSSFALMEGLLQRLEDTGLMNQIRQHKFVTKEPKSSMEMENCMAKFYSKIKTGALLFAVYRGKASEGIDFADEAARLVITVGIPYPSAADPKVVLKRHYNDNKRKNLGTNEAAAGENQQGLSGHQWYKIQAFRALNQAIGRCIRHRSDWGAMLMVDSRFDGFDPSNTNGLCKWIKRRKNHYEDFNDLFYYLVRFIERLNPANQIEGSDQ